MTGRAGGEQRSIRRITMLTNPAAGHGNAPHAAEKSIARFQQLGVEVVGIVGVDADDALRLARAAVEHGTDALVVTGGDGVISVGLQAVAETNTPLGIVPAGTGNDHAREYHLPMRNPVGATDIVVDGWTERADLGRIRLADGTERWFGTVVATGFDSLVSDRTNRMTWPHGRMRYNIALVAELVNLAPLPFRLVLDGDRVIERDVILVAFGNTRSYGGGMQICPGADRQDGQLDITVIGSVSRRKLIRLFPTVFTGTHTRLPEVETYRAQSIHVESPGINAYADGEYVGPLPGTVTAVPEALRILVPARDR